MKILKLFSIIGFIMLIPYTHYGAMVQFIHNTPVENLDFYINDQLQFPNMIFRHGTPFILLPDGEWTLQVAVTGEHEFIASFPIVLKKDNIYIYMVGGEKSDLQLFTQTRHRQYADLDKHIGFTFVHGAIDEEAVQLSVQEQTVFENLSFGVFSPFINVTTQKFDIAIEKSYNQKALIANRMDFDFWKGGSAVIFTSGYLDDREPRLRTYAMLSNGNSFPLEEIILPDDHRKVKIQLIQNSVQKVFDIYFNDELFANDFQFRDATTFLDFPKGEYFSIGIASADSRSYLDIAEYFTFKLEDDLPYIAFINSTEDGEITLMQLRDNVPENEIVSSVNLSFSQGTFQLPALDVFIDGQKIYDNVDVWEITDFYLLPSRSFRIDLTPTQKPENILYSYRATLGRWRGQSGVFYTAGLVDGSSPELTLQMVFPDTSFSLSPISNANEDEIENRALVPIDNNFIEIIGTHPHLNYSIDLSQGTKVDISLLNLEGKILQYESKGYYAPGKYHFKMNTEQLPPGVYFLRGNFGNDILTKKVVLKMSPN